MQEGVQPGSLNSNAASSGSQDIQLPSLPTEKTYYQLHHSEIERPLYETKKTSLETIDTTLFLLQDVLLNVLMQIRNQDSFYECYSSAKRHYETYYPKLLDIEPVFKILMNYPTEILSAMYIPVILRFFKWCENAAHASGEARIGRAIITSKKSIAFLTDDLNEYQYNTGTLHQAFEALRLLQSLQMALFPQKPLLYNDPTDEEMLTSQWKPLDSEEASTLMNTLLNKANLVGIESPARSAEVGQGVPLENTENYPILSPVPPQTSTSSANMTYQLPQHIPSLPSVSGSTMEFSEPSLMQTSMLSTSNPPNMDNLFTKTLPDVFQKLEALHASNTELKKENELLLHHMNLLKSQFLSLRNYVDDVLVKTPSSASPKMVRKSSVKPHQSVTGLSSNVILSHGNPTSTKLSSMEQNYQPSEAGETKIHEQSLGGYENFLGYTGPTSISQDPESIPTLPSSEPMSKDEGMVFFNTELQAGKELKNVSTRQPIRKQRPKIKNFEGVKLSKGEQYQPPVTSEGKHYLLDEYGKLAIVMANDQDSIYGIYNEYYQSLKPQVESYVRDFGKKSLVQFKKKRTFQKKKAFVYLVERMAYLCKMNPEQVLEIIDDIRVKENKSIVWACNNLGLLKDVLVQHRPDLREAVISDVE